MNKGKLCQIRFLCLNEYMEVKSAHFVKGILGTDKILLDGIPEIAFVGRSNVGKSSVINSLVNSKDLVKSSATPGKTKEINFFLINKNKYFVDLPGYGFARMGAKGAEKIRKLILWYLGSGEVRPKLIVLIVDAGIPPMTHDKEMTDILRVEDLPFIIIANKIDRLNQKERSHNLKTLESYLGGEVFPYSAKTKAGREELLQRIEKNSKRK